MVKRVWLCLFQLQRLNREARRNLMSRRVITEAYEPEDLPGGVWREGPRRECEYLPGGVWREGLGRDVSTYPGECGGRAWGETWVPTRGSVEEGTGERCEYLPGGVWREGLGRDVSTYLGECGGRDQGEMWVLNQGRVPTWGSVEEGTRERCEYLTRGVCVCVCVWRGGRECLQNFGTKS